MKWKKHVNKICNNFDKRPDVKAGLFNLIFIFNPANIAITSLFCYNKPNNKLKYLLIFYHNFMFTLSILPYNQSALEPHMSAQTLSFHYGKHHQAYVDNLNKLVAGADLEKKTLVEIIVKVANQPDKAAIFNNAAQVYNHDFFWQCLRPAAKKMAPSEKLIAALTTAFGSLDNFYAEFKTAALGQFGSGWVWLVKEDKNEDKNVAVSALKIMKTANADNPVAHGLQPLFGLDVWEHSYYLDYQNRRGDFVDAVLKNLINWEFVEANL